MEANEQIKDYKKSNILNIEKIYNDFYNYVYTIIKNKTNGYLKDEDMEEIIVDTFFTIWKNRDKLENERAIKPYIAGIVKNLIKEKIRKNNNSITTLEYEDIKEINYFPEEREEIMLLKDSIKELKKEEQEIFELYYYQNKKIKEISLLLNMSEMNIKQRLCRIRKKIKKNIKKEGRI